MNITESIYSVNELTQQIKLLLEDSFPVLWVEGEISNYKQHYSGHFYFTLKDEESQIACVMWKSRAQSLHFQIEDGLKVQIFGNLRVYAKSGRYQIDALMLQQAGVGDLQLRFEELKKKLLEEGFFNDEYKKPLPKFPKSIGVITSPTGAAVQDIINVLHRRFPIVNITVFGVKVQGEGAAGEIASAIRKMNATGGYDLLIVGRGGGSLEDLWAFNEEEVAKAIFESEIPIISAVGHEIDFTIADFVADMRAPTPSAAAELAVPNSEELLEEINDSVKILNNLFYDYIDKLRDKIENLLNSYAYRRPEDLIHNYFIKLDDLVGKFNFLYSNNIKTHKNRINHLCNQLSMLRPENVLQRGFALIYKDNNLIKSVSQVEVNDPIAVQLIDGSLNSIVRNKNYDKKSNI